MNNIKINYFKSAVVLIATAIMLTSCERDLSEEVKDATYPDIAQVFTDNFVGMGSNFYFPYGGSKPTAWTVDNQTGYNSKSSMRIDVPNANDPEGSYAGAILRADNAGRNLTKYDALTFYVKASQGVTLAELGFGEDFYPNKYITTITNVSVGTNWTKVIIPIPDASKLLSERGMFRYSMGTQGTNGNGYTVWFDEIRFEKLNNNILLYPFIQNGNDDTVNGFINSNQVISNIGARFNLSNGQNINVNASPYYFEFTSSNNNVTGPFIINEFGVISTKIISSSGTATITAKLGNSLAKGSIKINAAGLFPHAPTPSRIASKVTSIFSDAYNNVPVRHYNGFFTNSTTLGGAGNDPFNVDLQTPFPNNSLDNIIHYTQLNFVSIGMYDTVSRVNISNRTHLHVDLNVRQIVNPGNFIRIELHASLPNGPTTSQGSFVLDSTILNSANSNGWVSLDIPISNFSGFNDLTNLGQIFIVSGVPGGIFSVWVDNVYFYDNN
jgi:hypothetical protein